MSSREIIGLLTILPEKDKPNQAIKEDLQAGNIAFRGPTLRRTLQFWDTNNSGSNYNIALYPFKQGNLLDDLDITVGHSVPIQALGAIYPYYGLTSPGTLNSFDYAKFRATGSIGTIGSGLISRVHAGVAALDALAPTGTAHWLGDQLVSASDLPADYTQIGIVYPHPMYQASSSGQAAGNTQLVTTAGSNFVTFTNAGWWDNSYVTPTKFGVLRIATGSDAGVYFIQNVDFTGNRLALRNLNGTPFVAQASATIAGTDLYLGPGRTHFFNEVSVIKFSTGDVITGGRFNPGFYPGTTQPLRSSFITKIRIEKTGSDETAAAAEQQGSYYFSMRPWTHGDYDYMNGYDWAIYRPTVNEGVAQQFPNHTFPYDTTATGNGGSNAMILDEVNQRCWMSVTNGSNNSAILHWRWRTIESLREVANYLGTAAQASFLTPTPVLATGDRIRGGALGSNQWVYFAVQHPTLGNGGIIIIKPNLTTLQYTENLGGAAWTGTGDTIGGTAPSMTLTDSAALFHAGLVGQSITISGATGANNGTFLITGYTSPTVITYQNHAGTGETIGLTWTILGVPDSNVAAVLADKTRTRTGTAGDVSTNGANQLTSASGAFTASDIGRVIKLTGLTGNDNGVYKIATQGGTTATVTTLAGAAVTFTTQTGGTFEIGDRLYMLYNNGSTGLNKINYFESLAPGTFLERTFSSTAGLGANCNVQGVHGENQRAAIDTANGNLYWLSNDTTQQINKYSVATNAHTGILITDTALTNPLGGVPNNQVSTYITSTMAVGDFPSILVNSKFDEVWIGSNNGIFKLPKTLPFVSTDTGVSIGGTAMNMTLTTSVASFAPAMVGRRITIAGATTGANNGTFLVTSYTSPTVIGYKNTAGVAEAYTGTWTMELLCSRYWGAENTPYFSGTPQTTGVGNGTTGIAGTAPSMTLNAAGTPFGVTDDKKFVVITGSTTAGNNGHFPITSQTASSVSYTNSLGVAQGSYAGTFSIVPLVHQRSIGTSTTGGNTNGTRNLWELPDGRVNLQLWNGATSNHDGAFYSRETDTFVFRSEIVGNQNGGTSAGRNKVYDSIGWFVDFCYNAGAAGSRMWLGAVEVNYQWTGSAWIPKEVALAGTPNKSFADTTNPLAAAKPIHSASENLIYGAKVAFDIQGGATPSNNEFLGRMGQTRTTTSDGATIITAATFDGSGFVAGDAGRLIRIEGGADAGIYKIFTFVNAGRITLKTLSGGTFSALATAGTLTYTIWDTGSVLSNAGPEESTFILADGVSKDNTQDITGFTYEAYHFKTRLHENDEGRKFAVENPLAVQGSLATKAYWEVYPRLTPQYDAALAHHRALPVSELANGRQAFDGIMGKYMDGALGHALMYSNETGNTSWSGILANASVLGYSLMVDFGKDVELGSALLRAHCFTTEARVLNTNTSSGLRGALYKASDAGGTPTGSLLKTGIGAGGGIAGTAPAMTLNVSGTPFDGADVGRHVIITGAAAAANNGAFIITSQTASSVSYTNASGVAQAGYAATWFVTPAANVRTTGSLNYNHTGDVVNSTALSSGDFLGPISLTPTTPAVGAITSGLSILTDTTNAQFLASHVGQILKIAGPVDVGSYRIIGFTSSSVITISNLDQTAKTWTASSSTITYEIRDGVRDEDMLVVLNSAHRLCVERLLTTNTLQLRTPPNATITAQSWVCVKPSWTLVKKIAHSTEAIVPDVKNNNTWASADGREKYDNGDFKILTDFVDLSSAARTGRYWKFAAIPRFAADGSRADHEISTWEFYDVNGKRLVTSKYTFVDEARTNADFLMTHINRADFIQAANDAINTGTFNGNVNLGGGNGDTLTLTTGGNKFLGFQIGKTRTDGNPIFGGNTFNSAGSAFPAAATAGRFLWLQTGVNTGFYRILSRTSATQITVGPPSGVGSTVFGPGGGPSETGQTFSIHEGINVGGAAPDKFVFIEDGREFTLATINDTLTTLTFSESLQPVRTNKTWEIRRPAYDTASQTTEASKTARLTRPGSTQPVEPGTYPLQSGDLCHDSRGTYRFFAEDIGDGFQRADGVIAGGNGNLTGSGFTRDDVGRLLYVISGTGTQVNNGIYEIQTWNSATSITVKRHYDPYDAISFTADAGPVTYQIYGDRRFRLTRFVVGLRA